MVLFYYNHILGDFDVIKDCNTILIIHDEIIARTDALEEIQIPSTLSQLFVIKENDNA